MGTKLAIESKQRLQLLKEQVLADMNTAAEKCFCIGDALREFRDDELFLFDGFEDFKTFAEAEFGIKKSQAYRLIDAAEYRKKLPSPQVGDAVWTEAAVREFTRIPKLLKDKFNYDDDGKVKRESFKITERLGKKVVAEVEKTGGKLTSAVVRNAVNADLGIDPGAALRSFHEESRKWDKERRVREEEDRKREEENQELWRVVSDYGLKLLGMREALADVPEKSWKLLAQNRIDPATGERHIHRGSIWYLHEEARKLYEQLQRQLEPLNKDGLLDHDLADEELADVLREPAEEIIEQLDYSPTDKPR